MAGTGVLLQKGKQCRGNWQIQNIDILN